MNDQIFETVVTSLSEDGTPHVAPMGVRYQDDLVVVGNALSRGNPAIEHLLDRDLAYVSGPQWLGEVVLRGRRTLAVAGTHGKTTTTSMLLHVLKYWDRLPDYLVGAQVPGLKESVRLQGTDEWAVFEGDEYLASPLDPRGLADHPVAAPPRPGAGRAADRQSAFRSFALENLRQPPAQPGPYRADARPLEDFGAGPFATENQPFRKDAYTLGF